MYIAAQENEATENEVWEVDAAVEATLGALACYAGIGADDDYIQEYKDATKQLKPMYYKPKKAREALVSAVTSKACNAQDFRAKLLVCCTKTGKSMVREHNPNTTRSKRADKESARKMTADIYPKSDSNICKLNCSACGICKESSELHWCPCKTAFYVSNDTDSCEGFEGSNCCRWSSRLLLFGAFRSARNNASWIIGRNTSKSAQIAKRKWPLRSHGLYCPLPIRWTARQSLPKRSDYRT
jgi:hypothetical protein